MKKLISILTLGAMLASVNSFAAPVEYFKAVLESMPLQQALWRDSDLEVAGIKNTMTNRCPGCFTFEVALKKSEKNLRPLVFNTKLDLSTQLIEVTR